MPVEATHVNTCAGGKRKIIDVDAKATALRELEEETAGAHSLTCACLASCSFHMLKSHSHTVCYALADNIQQAASFRSPALEVVF